MSKVSLFQNLLESKYPRRDYNKRAAEYAEKKKERNRQKRNAEKDLAEGKATVVPAPLAKDKKAEAHIRSVNKYNKSRDEQVDAWTKKFKQGEEALNEGAPDLSLAEIGDEIKELERRYYNGDGLTEGEFTIRMNKLLDLYKAAKKYEALNGVQALEQRVDELLSDATEAYNIWDKNPTPEAMKNYNVAQEKFKAAKREWKTARDQWENENRDPNKELVEQFELDNNVASPETLADARNDADKLLQDYFANPTKDNLKRWKEAADTADDILEQQQPKNMTLPWQVKFDLPAVSSMSPQDKITRYHTTKMINLPGIYTEGLRTGRGGKGFGKVLFKEGASADELGEVYTTSREPFGPVYDTYTPFKDQVTLQLEIPKEDYKKLGRNETNPEENYSRAWTSGHGELLETIQNGGRTDIFQDNLKPTYIKGGYIDDSSYNSIEDLIRNYMCTDDCDDWYDALESNGFLNEDGDWNESLFEKLRNRK